MLDYQTHRLQQRLALAEAALAVALDAIIVPAFVVAPGPSIVMANGAGRARLKQDQSGTLSSLGRRVGADGLRYKFTPLSGGGSGQHYLACEASPSSDIESRIAAATCRWRLTKRQSEVLRLLLNGATSREIATQLDCALKTTAIHVGALLHKSSHESRVELVATVWSWRVDADGPA